MISWVAAAFFAVMFVFCVRLFGLVEKSRSALAVARRSFGVVRSPSLSDDAKEGALRKDAKQLFLLALLLAFGGIAAILLPAGVLFLCDRFGFVSLSLVFNTMISPLFIVISSVLTVIALYGYGRSMKASETAGYSALDRAVHLVAFKTCAAQVGCADIEDTLFARRLGSRRIDRPVFITALPRAGTTLLLECCANLRGFASHCYRDMPFVLIPCLWNSFSAAFRTTGAPRQRAHGDGMRIDFDSPEAFEEVVWQAFWRRHYRRDRIVPWEGEDDAEFGEFFRSHMRKIIFLRRGKDAPAARYVSKNNLNIARTGTLRRLFPDAVIVVPFRQPLQHAASLLEQHRNFLRIHREDPFASAYMRGIGHYDFGENLRPVDFGGWLDRRQAGDAGCLAFWLEYWVAGYRYLLEKSADSLRFLSYEALCDDPLRGLRLFADVIGSGDPAAMLVHADGIRGAKPRELDTGMVPAPLLQEAGRVYAELKKASLT